MYQDKPLSTTMATSWDKAIAADRAEYIYERIKTLLEAAGANMGHVCKTTAFITDPANYAAFNEVRSRYFPVDPPASSTVVTNLLRPDMLLEVEAIAVIPD